MYLVVPKDFEIKPTNASRVQCVVNPQVKCGTKFVQSISIDSRSFRYVNARSGDESQVDPEWTMSLVRDSIESIDTDAQQVTFLGVRFPAIYTVPKGHRNDAQYFDVGHPASNAVAQHNSEQLAVDTDYFAFSAKKCTLLEGAFSLHV